MNDDNNDEIPPADAAASEAGDLPSDEEPSLARGADDVPDLDMDALIGSGADSGDRSARDAARGSKPEWLEEEVSDEAVEENSILVPKHRRGEVGSRDYLRNLDAATAPLEPKLGVPSHFVSSRDGETEDGNQTKHQFIQETFVSNYDKLMQALLRAEAYDFMAIFMVPDVKDRFARKPDDIFNMEETKNIFLHWDSMDWKQICLWQKTLNKWAALDDRTSSRWAQSFLYKSSTVDLRERVDSQYKNLPADCKGGVTYLYLQLRIMFHMSRDTITALKKYLKLFEEKGLRRIRGENVVVAEKEINAVCTRLNEVGALPEETVVDVLEGLTNCSVPDFTKLFDFLLQAARVNALDLDEANKGDTLAQVKQIMAKAVDAYHALCTAGKWHVNHKRVSVVVCWNCGEEGHRCEKCPKPKNQANIEAAKKKWQSSTGSGGGGGGTSGGGGGKPPHQQQRKKWGHPDAPKDGAGIRWFDKTPKAWCGKKDSNGKVCGWNHDHSTQYHGQKMANPSTFVLADVSPQHPLVLAQRSQAGGGGGTPSKTSGGSRGDQVTFSRAQANDVLTKLERNTTSDETAEIVGALRNLMSLN